MIDKRKRIKALNVKLKFGSSTHLKHFWPLCLLLSPLGYSTVGFAQTYDIDGGSSETVDGSGGGDHTSPWALPGALRVGDTSTGSLTIRNSASVGAEDIYIGDDAGSDGTVTVRDSTIFVGTIAGNIYVGNLGDGSLSLTDSTTFSRNYYVGDGAGSDGQISLSGSSTTLSSTAFVSIGASGTGSLALDNGASAAIGSELILGSGATGAGTATVDNSSLSASDEITIGGSGSGTMTVTGSSATVSSGSDMVVGTDGTGTLGVHSGATVSIDGDLMLASSVGGEGHVTVNSGSLGTKTDIVVGRSGAGILTVSGSGRVSSGSGTIDVATIAPSTGTINIGSAVGESAVSAGTLNATTLSFGAGTGTVNFNHTDTNYVFSTDVAGDGTLAFYSGSTELTGDYSAFTGDMTISGGAVAVNTTIGTDFNVSSGGSLDGTGTLGTILAGSNGKIAPGNSIGTMNVASATFNSGSTLEVELNDGGFIAGTNNDLLNATGTVTITGGTINVIPENGTDDGSSYTPGTYTVITAGSVVGTFSGVTDTFVFLDFTDSYDATNVYITSLQANGFTDVAVTTNELSTASALEVIGGGNTLFDALAGLSGSSADARAAFNNLSGEMHASLKTVLLEDSRFLRKAALDRLGRAMIETEQSGGDLQINNTVVWGRIYGSWSHWNGNGNAATTDRTIGGLVAGADTSVSDTAVVGALVGYNRTDLTIDGRASSATVDSYSLGAYAGQAWRAMNFKTGAVYSLHTVDTTRSPSFGTFSENLETSYNTHAIQGFAEASHQTTLGAITFQPYANAAYAHLSHNGFTETGGSAALSAGNENAQAAFTTVGLRGRAEWMLGAMPSVFSGGLGWRHAFGDTPNAALAFSGGNSFSIDGVPLARDVAVLTMAMGVEVSHQANLSVVYNGQIGSGQSDHGLTANFRLNF